MILEALGKPKTLIRHVSDRPGHDRRYAVECRRLRELGWEPVVPFAQGLRETVRWYREHESWWRSIKSGEFKRYYEEQYRRRLEEGTACGS